MYKLILVDDEEDVREGVSQEIDWHAYGFAVLAKAENGKEALDLVERLRPDVVVTDIRMPFMDGLQLAEAVRRQFPATRIIILTGFDEFEYAQKAVKLYIDEYVLKPFSAVELIDALVKVKNRMDEEAAHRENNQLLRESYRKSLPVLREVFLSSLRGCRACARLQRNSREQPAHFHRGRREAAAGQRALRRAKGARAGPLHQDGDRPGAAVGRR